MKRAIILSVGWLTVTAALLLLAVSLDLHWNFFNWSPKWDLETMAEAIGVAATFGATWFLGKISRDKISRVVAACACAALVWFGIAWFPSEPTTQGFLGRSQPSPLWFRGGRLLLLCVPGLVGVWCIRRNLAQPDGPANGGLPVGSQTNPTPPDAAPRR